MNILANIVIDPTTLLLQVALNSVPILLETIFKIGKEIQETARRTKANRHQCLRLSERIDILTGFIREQKFDDTLSELMKTALQNFVSFLQKCLKFIEIFISAGYFKRLFYNKDYLLQFTEFHNELTQYVVDLNLSISLISRIVNRNQHEHDRLLDSVDSQQYARSTDDDQHARCYPLLSPFGQNLMMIDHQSEECQEKSENIFQSGIWKYQRGLNNTWKNPFHVELIFDLKTEIFQGFGEDHVDQFIVNGSFSQQSRTIKMIWRYNNEELNANHQQMIHLQWDHDQHIFFGQSHQQKDNKDDICSNIEQFELALFCRY